MATRTVSTRRDCRFRLRPGGSAVRFPDPRSGGVRAKGRLTTVSIAGFGFEIAGDPVEFPSATALEGISVQVGDCILEGDAVVRHVHAVQPGRMEVGCLFYPRAEDEERWTSLLAGIIVGLDAVAEPAG